MGSTLGVDPYFELAINGVGGAPQEIIGGAMGGGQQAWVVGGRLYTVMSPGTHNVVLELTGGRAGLWWDGHNFGSGAGGTSQGPTIYVGQRWDGSNALTLATLRNLKIDQVASRCVTIESDMGPGTQDQAVLLGDRMTLGIGSTAGNGGWGTQKSVASYGTTYYHMASLWSASVIAGRGFGDTFEDIWKYWGGASTAPSLVAACVMIGQMDISGIAMHGVPQTAADVWAKMQLMLDGSPGSATWTPPTSISTPREQRAWIICATPRDGAVGTGNFTINGTSGFSVAYTTSNQHTADLLAAQLSASSPVSSVFNIWVAEGHPGTNDYAVFLQVKVPGTSGNGLVCSTDGGGGSFYYGSVGGFPQVGTTASTYGGLDTLVSINGRNFVANFDTDADTTVNNLIAAIVADGPTNAIVTGTLVSHKMLLTANGVGWVTNYSTVGSNDVNGAFWDSGTQGMLLGGSNGVTQTSAATVVCTVPPFGAYVDWTSGIEAQRVALNILIRAYTGTGVTIYDLAASSASGGVADPLDATKLDPTFDYGDGISLNDAGHTQVLTNLGALLP